MDADLLFPASERFWLVEGVKGKVFSRANNERNAGIGPKLTHPRVFFCCRPDFASQLAPQTEAA